MKEEAEEGKTSAVEEWKWSETQGVELLVSADNNIKPHIEVKEASTMEVSSSSSSTKSDNPQPVRFRELFRFADGLDYVLMGIGTVGAIVHGSSLPLFLRFFADLVNSFGSNANDVDKMTQEVLKVIHRSLQFCLFLLLSLQFSGSIRFR